MVRKRQVINFFRDVDDTVKIMTGSRIPNLVTNGLELFGIHVKEVPPAPEFDINDPYFILGVRPEAHDIVVRGAYRALIRKYHPDGESPDEVMAKKINVAYQEICKDRQGGGVSGAEADR